MFVNDFLVWRVAIDIVIRVLVVVAVVVVVVVVVIIIIKQHLVHMRPWCNPHYIRHKLTHTRRIFVKTQSGFHT
jgi:hypothetical protein